MWFARCPTIWRSFFLVLSFVLGLYRFQWVFWFEHPTFLQHCIVDHLLIDRFIPFGAQLIFQLPSDVCVYIYKQFLLNNSSILLHIITLCFFFLFRRLLFTYTYTIWHVRPNQMLMSIVDADVQLFQPICFMKIYITKNGDTFTFFDRYSRRRMCR